MKIDITKRLPEVDEARKHIDNPRHLAILNNYVRHAQLEVCGVWEDIFAPTMMIDHPVYKFHTAKGVRVLDGMAAVKAEYELYVQQRSTVMFHSDGQILVNDNGFMTEYVSGRFWPGHILRSFGEDIDDPDAIYIVKTTIAMAWPYDDQLRLMSERVYIGGDRTVTKCAPDDVVTMEECREKLLPITPRVITPADLEAGWAG
jgi:hypothetical protein